MIANPYGCHSGSPAHAGIDLVLSMFALPFNRFPRTRGDRPLSSETTASVEAGSPAHAGIDHAAPAVYSHPFRFPRTRGDRPAIRRIPDTKHTVPPHTRG